MGLFIFRFWPVLIPLILHAIWHHYVAAKAVREGRPRPNFREGPWYWALLSSLLIAVGCFLYLGAHAQGEKGEYVPPHIEGDTIVPGHVDHQ